MWRKANSDELAGMDANVVGERWDVSLEEGELYFALRESGESFNEVLGGGACIFLQETKEQKDSIAVVNFLIFGHAIPCCGLECIHCDGEKPLAV